jgi:RimJ/RimL family protein N-acetyltransferase
MPLETEDAVRFVDEEICHVMDTPDTWFQMGIFLRDGQILIGDMGLHFLGTGDNGEESESPSDTVEIGITIAPDFQGRGFAAEAVDYGLTYLFETLGKEKVVASVDPLNEKSMELMKRIGFHLEGIHKDAYLFRGRWTDDAVFSMTRKQWKKTPKPSA